MPAERCAAECCEDKLGIECIGPLRRIRKGYRCHALVIGTLIGGVIVISAIFGFWDALNKGKTLSEVINGSEIRDGISLWGHFPNLILWIPKLHNVTIDDWKSDFFNTSEAAPEVKIRSKPEQPYKVALINASMLVPNFGVRREIYDGGPEPKIMPTLTVRLEFTGVWETFSLAVASTDAVAADLLDNTAGKKPPVTLAGLVENPKGSVNYFVFEVEKRIIPKPGRFWGWPFETGDHTQEEVLLSQGVPRVTYDAKNPTPPKPEYFLEVKLRDFTVTKIAPISLFKQFSGIIGQIGGLIAAAGSIFGFVFVKRYASTQDEELSGELTFKLKDWETFRGGSEPRPSGGGSELANRGQ